MKASLVLAALTLSLAAAVSAQAQTAPTPAGSNAAPTAPAPADFATRKANSLARIDQHLAAMTAMRDCVNAASTPADLKSCRHQARAGMQKHHPV